MRQRGTILVATLFVLLLASAVQAQHSDLHPPAEARVLTFEQDVIESASLSPEGTSVDGLRNPCPSGLLKIRKDFFKEIVGTADDI